MSTLSKRDRAFDDPGSDSRGHDGFETRPAKRGRPYDSPEEGEVDEDVASVPAKARSGSPEADQDQPQNDVGPNIAHAGPPTSGGLAKKKAPVAFPFKRKNNQDGGPMLASATPSIDSLERNDKLRDMNRGLGEKDGDRYGWDPRDRERRRGDRDWERDKEPSWRDRDVDYDERIPRARGYDRYVPDDDWRTRREEDDRRGRRGDDDWRTRRDDDDRWTKRDDDRPSYPHYNDVRHYRQESPPRHSFPSSNRHPTRRNSRSRSRSPPKHRLPVPSTTAVPIHLPPRPISPSSLPSLASPPHTLPPSDRLATSTLPAEAPPSLSTNNSLQRPSFQAFNMPQRNPTLPPPPPMAVSDSPLPPPPSGPPVRPPPAPLPNYEPKSMGLGAPVPILPASTLPVKNVFGTDEDEGEIPENGDQTVRPPESQEEIESKPDKSTTLEKLVDPVEDPFEKKIREMEALAEKKSQTPAPPTVSCPSARAASKVKRTDEQEQGAYGRDFKGCSKLASYRKEVKLGEGTFGEVFMASHIPSGKKVALKRILMHNESQGFPITAIREIKLLKKLKHRNVVELWDIVVELATEKDKSSIHMVFPYMDHDLAGLLENKSVHLSPSQVKLYMKQLLEGTAYLHRNHIVHRDIKAANLLIAHDGTLQIADFGLARPISKEWCEKRGYTNCVVTRWYRPPELLLGARKYDGSVDMWGIGCILGEMFERKPILMGESDMGQLDVIFALCGSPTEDNWPGWTQLEGCQGYVVKPHVARTIATRFNTQPRETSDLLIALLTLDPSRRITAEAALDHDYFWTSPLPADLKSLPRWEASKEYDKRRTKEAMHQQQQQHQHQQMNHTQAGYNNRPPNNAPYPNARNNAPFNRPPPGNGYAHNAGHNNSRNNGRPPRNDGPGLPPPLGFRPPNQRSGPPPPVQPLQPLRWDGSSGFSTAGGPPPNNNMPSHPPPPAGLPPPKYGGPGGYNGPLVRGGRHPDRPYAAGPGSNFPQGRQPGFNDNRGPPRDGGGSSLPYD